MASCVRPLRGAHPPTLYTCGHAAPLRSQASRGSMASCVRPLRDAHPPTLYTCGHAAPLRSQASRGSMTSCVCPLVLVTFAALAARVPLARLHALWGLARCAKKSHKAAYV